MNHRLTARENTGSRVRWLCRLSGMTSWHEVQENHKTEGVYRSFLRDGWSTPCAFMHPLHRTTFRAAAVVAVGVMMRI
jgi:hypothetical protein